MARVEIYTADYCPYCRRAKALLERKGIPYVEINIERDPALRQQMMQESGRRTVPQVFVDGRHLGDCTEIYAMDAQGLLDARLGLD